MDGREMRGMEIAATMPLRRDAKGWIVPSQTGVGNYRVSPHPTTTAKVIRGEVLPPPNVQPWSCTCPDFETRWLPCKHVHAVTLVIKRENVYPDGTTVTEEVKVTYTQDWHAYNKAQCEEGDRFPELLTDLCATIPNPPQGRGRPRLPRSDMAFACVSKVYAGLSARRFDSDVREAKAKGLTECDPHFNSVLRYLRDPEMTPVLKQLVELSALPLKGVETDFAVDGTGFSTCRYVRWYDEKWGKEKSQKEWIKLHAMTGVRTNIVTAVEISPKNSHDTNYFRPLVSATAETFDLDGVSADKAYSNKANAAHVEKFGATPFIPFKITQIEAPRPRMLDPNMGSAWDRMFHMFAYNRDLFLARYHQRSNVETTFSMIKRKFGDSLRSKSEVGQVNEVLCKVIAHNLCCLISAIHELGLSSPAFQQTLSA